MDDYRRLPLHLHLHGRLATTLEAHPTWPRRCVFTDVAPWLSSRWSGKESEQDARRWLHCCLPENGFLESWMEGTYAAFNQIDLYDVPRTPESLLWTHVDSEFPGAVTFTRDDGGPRHNASAILSDHERLDEPEVAALLREAVHRGQADRHRLKAVSARPFASLSGVRPKISISMRQNGEWCIGRVGDPNTHVVKVEDSRDNLGEAGIESICQRALAKLGLPAAETSTRVIGGLQCVLSRRSDRALVNGRLHRVHQEDFRQAGGAGAAAKYPQLSLERPGLPESYAILREHGRDPAAECDAFTGFLAAAWLLDHGDLHRGNWGFNVSHPDEGSKTVRLAPAYDVSSAMGTEFNTNLLFAIGQQNDPKAIRAGTWRGHARNCGEDPEHVIGIVADIAQRLLDAFGDARREASQADDNRAQKRVDERADKVASHIATCARNFLSGLSQRKAPMLRSAGQPS